MKKELDLIINEYDEGNMSLNSLRDKLLYLFTVSNNALIDYIETDAEVLIPIEEMFNKDNTHITKKEYGKLVIKYLVKELREHHC